MTRALRSSTGTLLLLLALAVPAALAQANVQGQWTTMPYLMPINPVHVALLKNGKVLVIAGSGNDPSVTNYQAALWDPQTGAITTQPVSWDMFCNGMVVLPDGRPFINGGTLQYDPFFGEPRSSLFDPSTNAFVDIQNMAHGRWYPTVTILGDGRVLTFSGLDEKGSTDNAVEIYTPGLGWSPEYLAPFTPALYPRLHLLPDGKVFYSGPNATSRFFDPSSQSWTTVANTNYSGVRLYGSSVLLPLTPANNYDARVIIMGGGSPSTNTTELIDLNAPTPVWQWGPSMTQPRIEMNAVLLPSGKILAVGGSYNDEDATTASLNADLYDPATNTISSAGTNAYPRLYHSVAMLLPDATVWLAGGNPQRGSYEPHMEIYKPAYLFTTNLIGLPVLAPRPTITAAPSSVLYGRQFTVQTPDALNIASVVLVRNGAVTHAFDMDQRLVGLSFTPNAGSLTVTAPPNGNIAPPGYYMLFILNNAGVPSVASFIQVTSPPDFAISASPPSRSVVQGDGTTYSVSVAASGGFSGNVDLSVTGLPQDATASFNPPFITGSGLSTLSVTTLTSTPAGTYTLTITGTSGSLVHSTTVKLVVTVPPDFSISATPSSRIISRGSKGSYTVTVSAIGNFSGTVDLSVTGLPNQTSGTFRPTSITGSGTSKFTVSVSRKASPGTYPLTIWGISGSLKHSTGVSLTIQ